MFKRELGNADWRLLPIAIALWFGMLCARSIWFLLMPATDMRCWLSVIIVISVIIMLMFSARMIYAICSSHSWLLQFAHYRHLLILCMLTLIIGFISSFGYHAVSYRDPLMLIARSSAPQHRIIFTPSTPPRTIPSAYGDCCFNAQVHRITTQNHHELVSYAKARFYAYEPVCSRLTRGATYQTQANLSISVFDRMQVQVRLNKTLMPHCINDANIIQRIVRSMWESFYTVSEQLDEQGRMLLPGLTIGLLGQEYTPLNQHHDSNSIDRTYAAMMRQHFQHSGIMHLMAVSGGHFMLLAALMNKICARICLPRIGTAVLNACAALCLASVVYPSASVWRALFMALWASVAMIVSRPYQPLSALCWTIIISLLVYPKYAWDYAFALSCCATMGILIMGKPLTKILSQYVPKCFAAPLSMTFAAQCWTLPIQMMFQPEVSVMSIFANMSVSPFVDWATLLGLLALVSASIAMPLALVFARLGCLGTKMMEYIASTCDDYHGIVLPWLRGISGALSMIVVEVLIYVVLRVVRCLLSGYVYDSLIIWCRIKAAAFRNLVDDATKLWL